ncbi:MAG: M20/M25/M40 family metallo-hydrolase [Bdellovibrionales bacterium]|nr:M20/M25/M40 family metallo-hydrolase [Bdellovibrionales bacterium]
MNFIQSCRQLIAVDTSPTGDCLEAVKYLAELGKSLGFKTEIQVESLEGVEQANILLRPNDEISMGDELMLQTHLDTVDPGTYSQWTRTESNPFNASIYENKIYGLGSADVKLDFLCKMFATSQFCAQELKRSFVLVGTYGAQSAMAGAIRLLRRKKVWAKYALVGEPTKLELVGSGQGLAVVEVRIPFSEREMKYRRDHDSFESSSSQSKMFSGRAAHSSMPHLGESAISKMFQFLEQLPAGISVMELDGGLNYNSVPASAYLEFDLVGGLSDSVALKIGHIWQVVKILEAEFLEFKDESFEYPYSSLNIGTIRTSEEGIVITGSCRLLPSISQDIYEQWMNRLKESCREVGGEFIIKDYKPSFSTEPDSDFVSVCRKVLDAQGISKELKKISASTEASVFHRMGIECLAFGPGMSIGNSHAPNENVDIEELELAKTFYRQVIERFCL